MILSYDALRRWFAEPLPPAEELFERLTFAGLEGEHLTDLRAALEPLIAARVTHAEPVDGTQLKRCELDLGDGKTAVVATAEPTVAEGDVVAYAAPGVTVGDLTVGVRPMGGVDSEGMLLSRAEAGAGGDGARVWRVDLKPGASLADAVDPDWLLNVGVTPNRGDWLSHLGVARELGVLLGRELVWPDLAELPADHGDVAIELDDADCPLYLGVRLSLDGPMGALPAEVEQGVGRSGMRCLHPLVDLSNYVMLELGQPTHAFDADKLQGTVRVRAAGAGETLDTLDGETRTLNGGELVIADDAGPIALAGVIGGARTEVDETTTNVLLESAWFDPAAVTRSRRPLGLSTEASYRFERGVDRSGAERAAARFLHLLAGVGKFTVTGIKRAGSAPAIEPAAAVWSPAHFERLIGASVTPDQAHDVLHGLGFREADRGAAATILTTAADEAAVPLSVPPWRFDIERPEDLIEEVARVVGFEAFEPTLPASPAAAPPAPPAAAWRRTLLDLAVARGFRQAVHLSFAADDATDAVPLANPLGAETRAMRTTLLPGLLKAAARNHAHQRFDVALVEIGKAFAGDAPPRVRESWRLALVQTGAADPRGFAGERPVDFYDLKGKVEQLLFALGVPPRALAWHAPDPQTLAAPWHPVRTAQLHVAGTAVGMLGALDPDAAEGMDLKAATVAAELDLDPIVMLAATADVPTYAAPPSAPASDKDLAFVVADAVSAGELLATVADAAGELLEAVRVFDVYRGQGVPEGHASLALRLTLRHPERTLTHEEIEDALGRVAAAAEKRHGAKLRG